MIHLQIIKMTNLSRKILTLKTSNQNASNWMVRDFISSNYFNISFRPKKFPVALKKIGFYIGKFKNTLSNFQREVSSVTKDIKIDDEVSSDNKQKKNMNKNG